MVNSVKLVVPQLEHLSVCPDLLETDQGVALQLYTFPRLLSCDIAPFVVHSRKETDSSTLAAAALGQFLKRHPGLTHLHTVGRSSLTLVPSPTLRIHLPNLQHFHGEATFIPAMMTRQLREARLYWSGREDIERIVVALRELLPCGR